MSGAEVARLWADHIRAILTSYTHTPHIHLVALWVFAGAAAAQRHGCLHIYRKQIL